MIIPAGLLLAACVSAAPRALDARAADIGAAALLEVRDLPIDANTSAAIAQQAERGWLDGLFNNKYTDGPALDVTADSPQWATWAHYQAAVYCGPARFDHWQCGENCDAVGPTAVIGYGGDNEANPWWYVADRGDTLVIAIAGTNTKSAKSIAIDLNILLVPADRGLFPDSKGVLVHAGVQDAFRRMAPGLTAAVRKGLALPGPPRRVTVLGHSLGGAIGHLVAVYLQRLLPEVVVIARPFASFRVGNPAWANYVDATLGDRAQHMVNFNDVVPHLPPKDWGWRHSSNEVWIPKLGGPELRLCSGQENVKCSDSLNFGFALISSFIKYADKEVHSGPYAGVMIKC
ncbi:hypothetical protein Q8F55_003033 [Vanrija albida]|uniref:Fungal lipase-type domain-containing protein n=1 Tax=Vanrija albida TaxID=181172 RepID=A0ABR3QCE5_9TREE